MDEFAFGTKNCREDKKENCAYKNPRQTYPIRLAWMINQMIKQGNLKTKWKIQQFQVILTGLGSLGISAF